MRKPLLLTVLIFPFTLLYSQEDSVLKNFKFRNANYRAISIFFNGSGQFQNVDYAGEDVDNNASAFAGAIAYQQTKSTDKKLFSFNAGLAPSFSSGKSKNENLNDVSKARSFGFSPQFTLNNKWFTPNTFFTELGIEGIANFSAGKTTYSPPAYEYKNKSTYGNLAIIAGIGKGRLENITDMQNASWLARTLSSENRLSRSLSPEELNGLGRAITAANNTRVLDYRKKVQFILETVDNYLQQNGLVSKTDIKYFSNLNDILFFAFNDPRLSGTERFIRIKPSVESFDRSLKQIPNDTKNTTETFNLSALLTAGINRYVPQSLKHQNDFGMAMELFYQDADYSDRDYTAGNLNTSTDIESTLKQAGLTGFFQHGIYPNTRTVINFKVDARGGYQDFEEESSAYFASSLQASWNYFISYRTRLICNLGGQYQNNIYAVNNSYYYLQLLPNNFNVFANVGIEVNL